MVELKPIEFALEPQTEEDYLDLKSSIIELIEKFKTEKVNAKRFYEEEVRPQLLALEAVKEKYPEDEVIQEYVTKKLETAEQRKFTKEYFDETIAKCEKNVEKYQKILEKYFTEEISNGFAYPNGRILIYCEIAKELAIEE